MMKYSSIKKLVKGTYDNTQHQNNAQTKDQSYMMWWGAADQCVVSHGTYIHIMI